MARRLASRSSRRNDKTGYVWAATSTAGIALDGSGADSAVFPILTVASDVGNGVGQAQCTLLRIRGYIDIVTTEGLDAGLSVFMGGIFVQDDSIAILADWTQIATYTQEDVLWTFGSQCFASTALTTEHEWGRHFEIDVRAKRRLRSGESVHLSINSFASGNGPDMNVMGAIRALAKFR